MLSVRVPEDLKELVDTDTDDNQEVVERALRYEYGGTNQAATRRRIQDKKRRKSNLETEVEERQIQIEKLDDQIQALKDKLSTQKNVKEQLKEKKLQEAKDILEGITNPTDPAVQNWAEKLNMSPQELVERVNK